MLNVNIYFNFKIIIKIWNNLFLSFLNIYLNNLGKKYLWVLNLFLMQRNIYLKNLLTFYI